MPSTAGSSDTICLQTAANCGTTGAVIGSGTSGQVAYFTTGGHLTSSSLFTDNGTSIIGIGSSSTTGTLNVGGISGSTALYIQGASSGSNPVAEIKSGGSSGDLLDLNDGSNTVASFDNSGNLTIGAAGNTTGQINLATAGSTNLGIIAPGTVTGSGNATFILPTEAASGTSYTLCTIDTCAVSSGGAGYINNTKPSVGIGSVQSANFYIQSADTSSQATAAIAAKSGQTGDLFDLQDSSGNVITGFTNTGKLYFNNGSNANLYASASNTLKTDGNLTIQGNTTVTLATAANDTAVCSNGGVLSSCQSSFEATTGNDFIKNQTPAAPTIQSGNEYFQAAGATVAATIRGDSASSKDILDLQTGASGNAIVAKFDSAGNLTAGTINTATISGGTLTSSAVNSLGVSGSAISATGALSVGSGGSGQLSLSSASGDISTGSNTINSQTISSAASFTGTLAVNTLGSAGSTILCQNGSKQISSCSTTYEANNGTDFIQNNSGNLTNKQTSGNFFIQGISSSVTAKIQGASGTGDILDLYSSAGTTTPVAKIDKDGNLTATSVITSTIDTSSSTVLNLGASGTPTTSEIDLNQSTKLAGNKGLSFASGNGTFDQSSSSGSFKTGTGGVSLNGATDVAAGKNLQLDSGNGQLIIQGYGAGTGSPVSVTANSLTTGNFLKLNNSGSSYSGTAILADLAAGGSGTFTGNFVDFQNNDVSQFSIDDDGTISVQGHAGTTASSCSTGEVLSGANYYGGIAVGGACSNPSGFATLQNAYDNSGSTNPQITLNHSYNLATGVAIQDDGTTPLTGNLFQVTSNGGGSVYLGVKATGIATAGNLTVSGGSPSEIDGELKATNTTANGGVSILASGITETNSLKAGTSFQFGVDTSGNISTTGSLAVAPGGGNPNAFNVSNNAAVSQTFQSGSSATAGTFSVTNSSGGSGVIVNGVGFSLADNSAGASGVNTINAINFGSVTHHTSDNFNGLTFGSGYDNIINAGSIYTVTGTGAVTEGGALTVSNGGATVVNTASGQNILSLQSAASTNVFTVDHSGNVTLGGTYNGQTLTSAASFTGTVALATLGGATSSAYLCYNSSNQIASCSTTGTGAAYVQGGNSFGAQGLLGTKDNNSLDLITNNTSRLVVGTDGTFQFQGVSNPVIESATGADLTIDTHDTSNTLSVGATTHTITVGNTNAATVATFKAGAYNLKVTNTGVGINSGTPDAALSFGNGADRTIDVLQASSGNGNNLTVQAGNASTTGNTTGGNLYLLGGTNHGTGTDGSVVAKAQDTTNTATFQIQNSSGSALLTADTSSNMRVNIGTGVAAPTLSGAALVVTKSEVQTTFFAGNGSGGLTVSSTSTNAYEPLLTGSARHPINVTLAPEYPGATLTGNGDGSNVGTMTSDFCSTTLHINDSTNGTNVCTTSGDVHNYYSWTTSQGSAQDYDIYVRYQVPSNFNALAASSPLTMYGWATNTGTDAVQLSVYQTTGGTTSTCSTNTNVATTNTTWTSTSVSFGSCTITANSVLTFKVHVVAGTGDFARAGEISFNYLSSY
ncbi:MAG TPA: hypothetical protein VG992_05120 [Candidatus Saccharimonadales bacterium]|nr:hypothetical protein [Candidatus Saccharimonadales bacterium]